METTRIVYEGASPSREVPGVGIVKRGEAFDGPEWLLGMVGFTRADKASPPKKPAPPAGGD